jgi:phage-related minor tail protein
MADTTRKTQLEVTVDGSGAKAGFDQIKAGAQDMAQGVAKAGQTAGAGLEGGIVAAVKRATEATQQASQSVMTWTGFLKQNMGPAMKEALDAGATHAQAHSVAIRKIAADWAVYKETVRSAGVAVANSAAGITQGTTATTAATDKLTASQARLMSELQRLSVVNTQGKAAWLEQRAAMLGLSEQATPYIAKIKQAEQAQTNLGMSAKQTTFALRQVPAQFTDIVTSLQAGQPAMQVLLQQGGQLKDLFGGIGPAARALGGYLLGLITPLTVTAAAIGGVGIALFQGSKELRDFQNAAIISGNALGQSASQFTALRDSIAGIGATKGKAAEVLTEIATNGKLAGSNIKGIAEAAILMEKATGQATAKTIEQFAELARAPVDAAIKLNEQYNFLTTAVFKQIKALEDQGRTLQAANVAETAYADALKSRATAVLDNAGTIEKAWRGITGAAKAAWDAMLGIGRTQTPSDKLAAAAADVARIQAQIAGVGAFGETGGGAATGGASAARKAALEKELESAKQALATAQRRVEIEASNTQQREEQNRLAKLGIDFLQDGEKFATKAQQRDKELNRERIRGQELVNAGIITQTELTQRLNNIREKYKESSPSSTGQSEVASIRARVRAEGDLIEQLRAQLGGAGPVGDVAKLTEGQRLVLRLQEDLATSIKGTARAQKEQALVEAQALVVKEQTRTALEAQVKAVKAAEDAYDKLIEATSKQADSIRDQAIGQEAVNANFGKGKTAIEQATLAQLKLNAAEADASSRFAPAYVAAINAKVEAQQRFVAALQQAEYLQEKQKLTEAGRVSEEEAQTIALELSLLGQSREVRDSIIAQRKVEVALAKELAAIEKLNLGEGQGAEAQREELRAKARANAFVDASNAANKVVLDEWQRTADSINNSLTDALLRGFEAGKDFAENFRDTIVNMFKTLVLRPIIQGVMAPVSGALSGLTNGSSALSTASSVGSLAGLGSSIGTAYTAGSTSVGVMAGSVAGGGGVLGGIGSALSAIPAVGWVALAGLALYSIFGKDAGGPKQDGKFGSTFSGIGATDNSLASGVKPVVTGLQTQYDMLAKSFGGQAAIQFGLAISRDPEGTSPTFLEVAASRNGEQLFSNVNRSVGRSDDDLTQAMQVGALDALIGALKASDLKPAFAEFFNTIAADAAQETKAAALVTASNAQVVYDAFGQLGASFDYIGDMAVDATARLVEAAGGIQTLGANLSSYFENFYSLEEKRQNTAGKISAALAGTGADLSADSVLGMTRQQFRALVEGFAAMGPAGEEAYLALIGVNSAFASITPEVESVTSSLDSLTERHKEYAAQLRKTRDELFISAVSPLSANAKRKQAGALLDSTLASAVAGDEDAIRSLGGVGRDFIEAVQKTARTSLEVASAFSKVQAALTIAAASEDARAIPGFAGGGVASGVSLVGESGPEVVDFKTPARVYTADQTRAMFGSGDLVPLVNELLAEIRALRSEGGTANEAIVSATVQTAARLNRWDRTGIPLGEDMLAEAV